jgi:hypothetical protein
MTDTTSQRRTAENSEGRTPRQPKRVRDALRAERETLDAPSFEVVAAATVAIPANERPRLRDDWLRAARRAGIGPLAKLALHEFASALVWKVGYARISTGDLAKRIGCKRRAATNAIGELSDSGLVVRRIDKRGDSDENETAKTAFPGLVELRRQGCGKASVEVGHDGALGRALVNPTGRASGCPDVGHEDAQSQSRVENSCVDPPGRSPGAQARATDSDFSNPGDTGPTVPVTSARPQASGAAHMDGKTGSAMVAVERVQPHNEPMALAESKGALFAAYPFTHRPDIDNAIRAHGFEPQVVWDHLMAKNLRRPIKIRGTTQYDMTENLGRYLISTAKDMAQKRQRKEADPDVLAKFRELRSPAWRPNGNFRRR